MVCIKTKCKDILSKEDKKEYALQYLARSYEKIIDKRYI